MSSTETKRLIIWRRLTVLLRERAPTASWSADGWDAVISLADELRLAPLLDHVLRAGCVQMPAEASLRLHRMARRGTLARVRAEQTLAEVASALDEAGIRFIVLKGLALSYTVYPTPDCRPMSDLDLLIDAHNREPVEQLFQHITADSPCRHVEAEFP